MPTFKNSKGASVQVSDAEVARFKADNGAQDMGRIGDAFSNTPGSGGGNNKPSGSSAPPSVGAPAPASGGGGGGPAVSPTGMSVGMPAAPTAPSAPQAAAAQGFESAMMPNAGFMSGAMGALNPRLGTRTSPALMGFMQSGVRY